MSSIKQDSATIEYCVEDVPFSQQKDHYSCVAHCLWMVINHFGNKDGHNVPNLSVDEIRVKIKSSQELATDLENVININDPLKKANPILTFYPDVNYSWDDILSELREQRPVIAWMREFPDPYDWAHSVVLVSFDPTTNRLVYIDPLEGEKVIYVGDFLEKWENAYKALIIVKVGEVFQIKLDDALKGEIQNDT